LDEIEEGKQTGTNAVRFLCKVPKDLRYAEKHMENIKAYGEADRRKNASSVARPGDQVGKHGSFTLAAPTTRKSRYLQVHERESINLPDLDSADIQETAQEEYCENCGRVMVLKRGRFGSLWPARYPDCKTTRRLDQARSATSRSMKPARCASATDPAAWPLRRIYFVQRVSECKYVKQTLSE